MIVSKEFFCLIAAASLCLSGCTQTRKTLGLDRSELDGFDVYDHPDLTVPPSITDLPKPGSANGLSAAAPLNESIKSRVLGASNAAQQQNHSPAVKNLLDKAGAGHKDDKTARADVDKDAKSGDSGTFIQKMLPWQKNRGDTIDPVVEYDRFYENAAKRTRQDGSEQVEKTLENRVDNR